MSNSARIQGQDALGDVVPVLTDSQGRLITTFAPQAVPSATQGPATILINTSINTTLIAAPGVGFAIRVTAIQASFDGGSTVIVKAGTSGPARLTFFSKGESRNAPFALNPAWHLPENTPLVALRTAGNKDVYLNYNFYVDTI